MIMKYVIPSTPFVYWRNSNFQPNVHAINDHSELERNIIPRGVNIQICTFVKHTWIRTHTFGFAISAEDL